MNHNRRSFIKQIGLLGLSAIAGCTNRSLSKHPNIIIILVDDMGYGDPQCYNPKSKIPTENINQLAQQGKKFTNAHSAGSTCVPARYGLLTGRYPFRADMSKARKARTQSLIDNGRLNIASLLKQQGYHTVCIGKWHLGFNNWTRDTTEYDKPLAGGPVDIGFDYFYGMHASLDIPPYFYIENNRYVKPTTETIKAGSPTDNRLKPVQGPFWRAGKIAPQFKHEQVLETWSQKAVDSIAEHQNQCGDKPFFLYLALTAPHTPWLPADRFQGKTTAGDYGDFVAQVDSVVGDVLEALNQQGMTKNTLVIFTSDNGPVWFKEDTERFDHSSTGYLRGMKADAWEGGHRIPFIARWPGKIKPNSTSDEMICFTDMLATFSALTGTTLPKSSGEDSYNILPALLDKETNRPIREALVIEDRAILRGKWKLVMNNAEGFVSQKWSKQAKPNPPNGELYDLKNDPHEQINLYDKKPQVVTELTALYEKYRTTGRSAPLR